MGESDRYIDRSFKKITLGDDNNALMMLVGMNALIFISFGIIQILYYLTQSTTTAFHYEILRWFIVPAKLSSLAVLPWTIFTYMFVHVGVIYTVITLVWLWVFGSILQDLSGNSKIIPLYIYGGIAGAVVFVAANYFIPSLRDQVEYSFMLGGNAGIMAIAVATTTLSPDYRLFKMLNGGIPLWILTLLYIVIDIAGSHNMGEQLAHLGGGLIGFLFIVSLKKGYDWSLWMHKLYNWFLNLFNPDKPIAEREKIKEKVFYNTGATKPFVKRPVVTQQRIDEILDKINQKGFSHLSEEEKTILKKAGEIDF
ncbi:MAG TPA: rhomboid family intramembrane serine protease [Hanamia sp.]|jgi:membrane associated rhomboid family serine protease|nr:rhomboid family intramembrane serine protease [Hanamia sp.]